MDIENNNNKDKSVSPVPPPSSWGARHKFILKSFLMCSLLYSLRFNLSLAIVAMVDDEGEGQSTSSSINSPPRHHEDICPLLVDHHSFNDSIYVYLNTSDPPERRSLSQYTATTTNENVPNSNGVSAVGKTFQWNEKDQGLILGSFFWGYMASQFPGGLLAYKYGGKWVAGLGMIWLALFGIALPQAAVLGGRDFVVFIRVLQGFSSGFVVPSLIVLLAKWSPPQERARLSAMCMSGLPLGTAMTMIVSGYLIPTFGWPAVFYTPGILTIFWFIWWSLSVYSSPEEDPTISSEELKYFTSSTTASSTSGESVDGGQVSEEPCKFSDVPWRQIATSIPVWTVFISQFCSAWGHNMLKSEGPKYLHSALHFDIHQNSYVSASPYLLQFVFMLITGRLSDFLIERKYVSMLNARKFCNTIGQWGGSLFFIGIILAGCNRTVAVIFYIMSGMVNGAMIGGAYVNIIDVSPKYAGSIEGLINAAANIAGFGAPYLAGLILFHEPSMTGWNYVFLVPVISNLIGNLVFLLGASATVQSWNNNNNQGQNCDKNKEECKNNNE